MKKYTTNEKKEIYGKCYIERPLTINPELAKEIGLNEAIVLQQMIWLIGKSNTEKINGIQWTYQSFEKLHEVFPFFSVSTIKKTIYNLIKMDLLLKGKFNKKGYDRTNWYALNDKEYDNRLVKSKPMPLVKSKPMDSIKPNQAIPYNTTYTTVPNNRMDAGIGLSNEPLSNPIAGHSEFETIFPEYSKK